MKALLKLFLEILALFTGAVIFITLAIVGICYTFGKHIIKLDYSISKQLTPIVRAANLVMDCFANAAAGELLNDALKIKGKIKYGKWYQTISAVTGLINIYEKDTWLRRFLDRVFCAPHCEEAINPEDRFYWENIK